MTLNMLSLFQFARCKAIEENVDPASLGLRARSDSRCSTMDSNNQEPNVGDRIFFFTFLFASCCCWDELPQTPDFKQCEFTLWQFCS